MVTIDDLRTTISGAVYTEADEGFPEMRAGHTGKDVPDIVVRAPGGVHLPISKSRPASLRNARPRHFC